MPIQTLAVRYQKSTPTKKRTQEFLFTKNHQDTFEHRDKCGLIFLSSGNPWAYLAVVLDLYACEPVWMPETGYNVIFRHHYRRGDFFMPKELRVIPTPGVKMMFLIKRRTGTSREELIAYWFAHHMPGTIKAMRGIGTGYIGTVYDDNEYAWDGVAQMFMDKPLKTPNGGHGRKPADSFHEHVQPYFGWSTREYVVLDGSSQLPVHPLSLNAPFPTTRSGFFKVTYLMKARPQIDHQALYDHWLKVHSLNVSETMGKVEGFRYVVGHSLDPDNAPYAGMAELYFPDQLAWNIYQENIQDDGMGQYISDDGTLILEAQTEFVAIP